MKPDEPMGLETCGFHLGMLGMDGIRPTRCVANGEWHPLSSSAVILPQNDAEMAWENRCLGVDRAIFERCAFALVALEPTAEIRVD